MTCQARTSLPYLAHWELKCGSSLSEAPGWSLPTRRACLHPLRFDGSPPWQDVQRENGIREGNTNGPICYYLEHPWNDWNRFWGSFS